MKLLVVSLRVKEVDGASAGPHNRSLVVTTLTLQERHSLIKRLWGYLESLMRDTVFLKRVPFERARTLKQHHVCVAAP